VHSEYKTIGVVGATGALGHLIVKEFLKHKEFKVKVLVRSIPTAGEKKTWIEEHKAHGATVHQVNFHDMNDLKKALEGVHVLISALNGPALMDEQMKLVEAAKSAKVKRFIPSEFGIDSSLNHPEPFAQAKMTVQKAVKNSGMEYTFFYNGLFMDNTFLPWFGFDLHKHTIKIMGEGKSLASFMHRCDVAKYVVESVLHPEKSCNKELRFEAEHCSLTHVVDMLKKMDTFKGKDLKVEHIKKEEVMKKIKEDKYSPHTFPEQLAMIVDEGRAIVKHPMNSEFPAVHPMKMEKYLETLKI